MSLHDRLPLNEYRRILRREATCPKMPHVDTAGIRTRVGNQQPMGIYRACAPRYKTGAWTYADTVGPAGAIATTVGAVTAA
jgi:hypothetical protein